MVYPGGKNGAGVYQTIINVIPRHWRYIEAFAGSAAIYRHKLAAPNAILIEKHPEQAERLHHIAVPDGERSRSIVCNDARHELRLLRPGRADFIYLDPPYHPDARRVLDLYECEMTAHEHEDLLELLHDLTRQGARWALSGYRCPVYDQAAARRRWKRIDYQAMTRRGPVIESLWLNYEPGQVELHDYRHLGRDFRERERIARKVRRWTDKLAALPLHERGAILASLASLGDASSAAAIAAGSDAAAPSSVAMVDGA